MMGTTTRAVRTALDRSLRLFWVFLLLAAAAQATTVTGDIADALGNPVSGDLVVSWPSFVAPTGELVARGTKTVRLSSGAFAIELFPNDGASPTGTYYTVRIVAGTTNAVETWVVPDSASPVDVATVRTAIPPTPGIMLLSSQVPPLDASKITSGQFPIERLASGTPDGTKFVRDDGTLAVPSGGDWGDITGIPAAFPPESHAASHQDGGADELAIAWGQLTGVPAIPADLGDLGGDSDDVSEGAANLYHTAARARAAISAGANVSYDSGTGVVSVPAFPYGSLTGAPAIPANLGDLGGDSDDVGEGAANLYHTAARARAAISAGANVGYDSGTGVVSVPSFPYGSLTGAPSIPATLGDLADVDETAPAEHDIVTRGPTGWVNGNILTRVAAAGLGESLVPFISGGALVTANVFRFTGAHLMGSGAAAGAPRVVMHTSGSATAPTYTYVSLTGSGLWGNTATGAQHITVNQADVAVFGGLQTALFLDTSVAGATKVAIRGAVSQGGSDRLLDLQDKTGLTQIFFAPDNAPSIIASFGTVVDTQVTIRPSLGLTVGSKLSLQNGKLEGASDAKVCWNPEATWSGGDDLCLVRQAAGVMGVRDGASGAAGYAKLDLSGIRIGGTAPAGYGLRGNGTDFVAAQFALSDLTGDSDNVAEGAANLYHTAARARAAISAGANVGYDSGTGVVSVPAFPYGSLTGAPSIPAALGDLGGDSDDVAEGVSNLYHTAARARAAISAGANVGYDSGTGVVSVPAFPYGSLTGVPATFPPAGHAASHVLGQPDQIAVHASQVTGGQFAMARLASGTPDGTKFVRDDGTLAVPGVTTMYVTFEIPFGWTELASKEIVAAGTLTEIRCKAPTGIETTVQVWESTSIAAQTTALTAATACTDAGVTITGGSLLDTAMAAGNYLVVEIITTSGSPGDQEEVSVVATITPTL